MKCTPRIDWRYWMTISVASVLGANIGDYMSDVLNLGHLNGLPYLAAALVAIFLAERFGGWRTTVHYWAAIIVIRAAATNIGDSLHDFRIGFGLSVPVVFILTCLSVAIWRMITGKSRMGVAIDASQYYWTTMFLAGVLGTLAGDALSYPLGFGNLGATLMFGIPAFMMLIFGRSSLQGLLPYYWTIIVLVRSAGTALGDYVAHRLLGLGLSTLITALVYVLFIVVFYEWRGVRHSGLAAPLQNPGR